MKKLSIIAVGLMIVLTGCNSLKTLSSLNKGNAQRQTVENDSKIVFEEEIKFDKITGWAQNEYKPIFIDFYTEWCAPCKWLEQDVFETQAAAEYFNENLINFKVDAEKGEGVDLALKYNVTAYPTVIYLDPYGNEIERNVGMSTASNLIAKARKAVRLTDEMKMKERLEGR